MINEIFQLAETLKNVKTNQIEWHRKYKNIPNVKNNAPCLCFLLDTNGHISDMISLTAEIGKQVRKYGNNQGTFPALNLWPLFQVSPEAMKEIEAIRKKPELLDADKVTALCVDSNWSSKLYRGLKYSLQDIPAEMQELIGCPTCEAAEDLWELIEIMHHSNLDSDFEKLHEELKNLALMLLRQHRLVSESLDLLFQDNTKSEAKLSVVFDLYGKTISHLPVIATQKFSRELNSLLVAAEQENESGKDKSGVDAFQMKFAPSKDPMPSVKLPGFDVTIYTMFSAVPCQNRYGNFKTSTKSSYPLSFENRNKLKQALEWISKDENKGKTWMNLGKGNLLFCYPLRMPDIPIEWVSIFGGSGEKESEEAFSSRAERLIKEIRNLKVDPELNLIQIFVLWKVDKARTKIVLSGEYSFESIGRAIQEWREGCANIPEMQIKGVSTIYPLEVPRLMNLIWRQDSKPATTDKTTVTVKKLYEGIDLFFSNEKKPDERLMLRNLLLHSEGLAIYGGDLLHKQERLQPSSYSDLLKVIPSVGLLLYRLGERKEKYMKNYPYLLGQLLHISDELHAFYCTVVRTGDVPPKLAGSSLYSAAAESPVKTLALLGSRMLPYITWAKSYRYKNVTEEGKKSAYAGRYLRLYEETMNQLAIADYTKLRFNDMDKAELFMGYLASLPKKEVSKDIESENSVGKEEEK